MYLFNTLLYFYTIFCILVTPCSGYLKDLIKFELELELEQFKEVLQPKPKLNMFCAQSQKSTLFFFFVLFCFVLFCLFVWFFCFVFVCFYFDACINLKQIPSGKLKMAKSPVCPKILKHFLIFSGQLTLGCYQSRHNVSEGCIYTRTRGHRRSLLTQDQD